MGKIREFMTGWERDAQSFRPTVWSEREEKGLLKTARSSRGIPDFRAFDLIAGPNQQVELFRNDTQRIGVESVVGPRARFTRNIDFDLLVLQFAGRSTVETEFGVHTLAPGELMLIPGGIAHRSTGSADGLRLYAALHEPVATIFGPDDHHGHTNFEVRRIGGPDWSHAAGGEAPKGAVVERMVSWYDAPDDFTEIERDYDDLVGASSLAYDEPKSGIATFRIFDVFWELTGAGRGPGPKIVGAPGFMMEVYNTRGPQHAYHRALRTDEFGVHFRGRAVNLSELEGEAPVGPGDFYLVPRGIAHRIRAEDDFFLRTVLYSEKPWEIMFDPAAHAFDSRFEIETTVITPPDWAPAAAE